MNGTVDAIVELAGQPDYTEMKGSGAKPFTVYGRTEGTEIIPIGAPIIQEYTMKAAVTAAMGSIETYIPQFGHDESKCSTDTGFSWNLVLPILQVASDDGTSDKITIKDGFSDAPENWSGA